MEHHQGEQPGTELEARREMLPAELVAAPNRAGAIVAEFVNSIVEEAQARALEMIRAAANQDDAGQREALERADRMRARIDTMAQELEDAVGALRQESERLASLREETTFVALTGASPGPDTGERAALEQVAAGLERAEAEQPAAEEPGAEEPTAEEPTAGEPDEDRLHEVEVVSTHHDEDEPEAHEEEYDAIGEAPVEGHAEEDAGDEPATAVQEPEVEEHAAEEPSAEEDAEPVASAPDTEVEPGPEELLAQQSHETAEVEAAAEQAEELAAEEPVDEVVAAQEPEPRSEDEEELAEDQERFARMNDDELARAYSDALDQMDLQPAESERGARLLRYAGSALGEALTRPTFADIGQGPPPLEDVPRMGRRRRRRAESINTLRRACAQAIDEMSSAEEALR